MRILRTLLVLASIASLAALVLSIWPGLLADVVFICAFAGLFAAPFAFLAVVISGSIVGREGIARLWRGALPRAAQTYVGLSLIVVLLSYLAVSHQLPRRAAFLTVEDQFQASGSNLPKPRYHWQDYEQQIGPYTVDAIQGDGRGGVYFRLKNSYLSTQTEFYGFALRPNAHGSPFGDARYAVWHVTGDWYCFRAAIS